MTIHRQLATLLFALPVLLLAFAHGIKFRLTLEPIDQIFYSYAATPLVIKWNLRSSLFHTRIQDLDEVLSGLHYPGSILDTALGGLETWSAHQGCCRFGVLGHTCGALETLLLVGLSALVTLSGLAKGWRGTFIRQSV